MFGPRGNTRTYADERQRLLEAASQLSPTSDEYHKVMTRIDQLDKIAKRSSDAVKALIPASATVVSLMGLYALQQVVGLIPPKPLEALVGRFNKNSDEKD